MDKFYTTPEVARQCTNLCLKYVGSDYLKKVYLEPSAGNGAFIDALKAKGCTVHGYDIAPERRDITKQDFLTFNYDRYKGCVVIGNPPFGTHSSMAIQFIKRCCLFADWICFILPLSFEKEHLQKSIDLNFKLVKSKELRDCPFVSKDGIKKYNCVFQIWKRSSIPRVPIKIESPEKFKFTTLKNAQYAISVMGLSAGLIYTKSEINKDFPKYYFIKTNVPNFYAKYKKSIQPKMVHLAKKTMSSYRSLSRNEITRILNESI